MMVFIPTIYFILLTLFFLKKQRSFGIASFLSSLYALSAFFSILIDRFNYYGEGGVIENQQGISLVATVVYCFLLTLTIYPFSKLDFHNIVTITLRKPLLFDGVCYFFFAVFLLTLFFLYDTMHEVLSGDLAETRNLVYADDTYNPMDGKTGIWRIIAFVVNIFQYFSPLLLVFWFYSICFLSKSGLFNGLLLLSTTSQLLYAIRIAGRSDFLFYMLMFAFCFLLFKPFVRGKVKRRFLFYVLPVLCLAFVYVGMVTISRFGDRESNAMGGLIQYAGQGYLNFCTLFDAYEFQGLYMARLFPMFHHFVLDEAWGADRQALLERAMGMPFYVFFTFIGTFLVDTGKMGMFLIVLLYTLFAHKFFGVKKADYMDFSQLIVIFLMASIPIFGIFFYRYCYYPGGFFLLVSMLLYFCFKYSIKRYR